ncbi:MAG: sugar phosphate isomerase/epimerase [Chitinophagaceae bacterium]
MPLMQHHIKKNAADLRKDILRFDPRITCAYLFTITKYGYPPDVQHTLRHIDEMADMGFVSIELEGIGETNIRFLSAHTSQVTDKLAQRNCHVPVFCVVLPGLGATDADTRNKSLELFRLGCKTARAFGAEGVLDNGPLLPLVYPPGMPVMRHYSSENLQLPAGFNWDKYHNDLVQTFRTACNIAAEYDLKYHLHPCEGSLVTTTDSFINFSHAVGCDNLMFNLDTANQFFMKDNLELSILRLIKQVSYIHISDNSGIRVEHTIPGNGKINWNNFFSTLQKAGFTGKLAIDVGGAETSTIKDIEDAYHRSAVWLSQQINSYLLN